MRKAAVIIVAVFAVLGVGTAAYVVGWLLDTRSVWRET